MSDDKRPGGRGDRDLRPVSIDTGVMKYAEGSARVAFGDTIVLVSASVENRVPPFRYDSGLGWITAEYSMLPRATHTRSSREVSRGRPSGRTSEIQRLIGRALRAAVDMKALGERTVTLDCDVLQADGGTRTASITGAWVALVDALAKSYQLGDLDQWPVQDEVAAISVGMVTDRPLLDLEYVEDSAARVDMNVVGTGRSELVEVQSTAERGNISRAQFDALLDLGMEGIETLVKMQREALAPTLAMVRERTERGAQPAAPPRDEAELWGAPKAKT